MKPNKILILHGFESNSREHWFLKAKELFEKDGFKVFVPDMPETFFPKKEDWVRTISSFKLDEDWILIGHSLGGVAILKYLEDAQKPIGRVILLSVPYEPMSFKPIENFFTNGFNWTKIKSNCPKFDIVNEDADPVIPVEHGQNFAKFLGGKLHLLHGFTHFDKIDLDFLGDLIK